jgi:carbon storage regulator
MLVLSRKVGERIQLGDHITVTLVRINGNAVRLGIEAPPHMTVVRQELAERAEACANSVTAAKESTPH